MRLIQADDYNDVVHIFITGATAVDEIAPGVVRVSYFVERWESTGTTATLDHDAVRSWIHRFGQYRSSPILCW
jgi:hypothetical protein